MNSETNNTVEKTTEYLPGRVGISGTKSHILRVVTSVENAGTPWEKKKVHAVSPLCCGNRGQYQKAGNGIRWNTDITEKTVTCAKCREFKKLFKDETAG